MNTRTKQNELFPKTHWLRAKDEEGHIFELVEPLHSWGYTPTLPEICLAARASCNGASDPWSDDFMISVRDMLQDRIDNWYSVKQDKIDTLVYEMVIETIHILSREIDSR